MNLRLKLLTQRKTKTKLRNHLPLNITQCVKLCLRSSAPSAGSFETTGGLVLVILTWAADILPFNLHLRADYAFCVFGFIRFADAFCTLKVLCPGIIFYDLVGIIIHTNIYTARYVLVFMKVRLYVGRYTCGIVGF